MKDLALGSITAGNTLALGDVRTGLDAAPSGPTLPAWITHAWEADSLALTDGDPVTTWTDSVAAAALSQSTTSLKPIYRAASTSIESDGVDDTMSWTLSGELDVMLTGATYTMAWCGTWDDYGGGVLGVPVGNTVSSAVRGAAIWLDGRAGQNALKFAHNASGSLQITSAPIAEIGDTAFHTVVCVANGNVAQGQIYVDGAEVASYSAQPNLVSNGAAAFPEWRAFSSSGGFPHDGKTNGIYLATNHAASAVEVAALHAYRVSQGTI